MTDDDSFDSLLDSALGHLRSGAPADAYEILLRLRAMRSDSAEAARAFAEACFGMGRMEDACDACEDATRLRPGYERAHFLLGVIRARLGSIPESIASLREAIQIRPEYPDAVRALAATLNADKQFAEALRYYRRAIDLGVDDIALRLECASAAENSGDVEEAIQQRKEIKARRPDDVENLYNLAALTGEAPPPISPRSMIVKTFDQYAETFDKHLCEKLEYCGPELLVNAVRNSGYDGHGRVLDLGCGTGLCGESFRALSSHLVGVDISREMVQKAGERGIYDELFVADALDFLAREDEFDLVVAGDLFIYLGDLALVFEAVSRVLRPSGLFAFTLERDDSAPLRVNRRRRYTHSRDYLMESATQFRFTIERIEDHVLRQDGDRDVNAMIVVARPEPAPAEG